MAHVRRLEEAAELARSPLRLRRTMGRGRMTVREERRPNIRGRVEACGTVHTADGWERRKMRDKARQRARIEVSKHFPREFRSLMAADTDRRYGRKYSRSLRTLAAAHPDLFDWWYRAHLAEMGYEPHACNSMSTRVGSGSEISGPRAARTAGDLPEPSEGSEMAKSNRG